MKKQRLDKFISNQLLLSRSIVRTGILRGKATVNGNVVRNAGEIIDAGSDQITYESKPVAYKSRKTVVDLVPQKLKRPGLFPVGRLDKDTTGLLLITDDGIFAHNCISPKKAISKSYIVTLDGNITDDMIKVFKTGVVLADGTLCKPAILERVSENVVRIIITEGKYHQIKRMLGTVGIGVYELHREAIGGLLLPDGLKAGECVEMTKEQLENSIFHR